MSVSRATQPRLTDDRLTVALRLIIEVAAARQIAMAKGRRRRKTSKYDTWLDGTGVLEEVVAAAARFQKRRDRVKTNLARAQAVTDLAEIYEQRVHGMPSAGWRPLSDESYESRLTAWCAEHRFDTTYVTDLMLSEGEILYADPDAQRAYDRGRGRMKQAETRGPTSAAIDTYVWLLRESGRARPRSASTFAHIKGDYAQGRLPALVGVAFGVQPGPDTVLRFALRALGIDDHVAEQMVEVRKKAIARRDATIRPKRLQPSRR